MQLKKPVLQSGTCRTFPRLLAAWVICLTSSGAEVPDEKEEPLVVSATRMETPMSQVGSSVTSLDLRQLELRGIFDLQTALAEVPGVIATSTGGQRGALGSLFIRGTTTSESQVIVDGVRLSDSTAPLGNFLGTATLNGFESVEILRGPQSALYGGEAIGGVVSLTTARGVGEPGGAIRLEAGSFGSTATAVNLHGSSGRLGYALDLNFEDTSNDAKFNDFRLFQQSLRLDYEVNDCLTVGLTARGSDSSFEAQGSSVDHLDAALVTLFAEARLGPEWTSKTIAGYFKEAYDSDSTFGNFATDLERMSLSMDHQVGVGEFHRIAFGGFFERVDYQNSIGSDENRDRHGVHAGWEWNATSLLTTYLAARWEDYAAYGDEFTYRGTVAYRIRPSTVLRTSYGKAFRTPSYLDLFGTAFGAGNPLLSAEKSRGWDLGIEQMLGDAHRINVTYFRNQIDEQIQSFPTPPVNVEGTTRTSGIEAAVDGSFDEGRWNYRMSYTHLEKSLADQPRHVANASIDFRPLAGWVVGTGAAYVDERAYGGAPLDDYLLVRVYASYQWTEHLRVHGRIENLTDQEYQLSNFGVPLQGRGLGYFAGLTYTW